MRANVCSRQARCSLSHKTHATHRVACRVCWLLSKLFPVQPHSARASSRACAPTGPHNRVPVGFGRRVDVKARFFRVAHTDPKAIVNRIFHRDAKVMNTRSWRVPRHANRTSVLGTARRAGRCRCERVVAQCQGAAGKRSRAPADRSCSKLRRRVCANHTRHGAQHSIHGGRRGCRMTRTFRRCCQPATVAVVAHRESCGPLLPALTRWRLQGSMAVRTRARAGEYFGELAYVVFDTAQRLRLPAPCGSTARHVVGHRVSSE